MSTIEYAVQSLDVLGHSPKDCLEYDCPCADKYEDADPPVHDDMKCQCGFEVNDAFGSGSFEIEQGFTYQQLLQKLKSEGLLKSNCKLYQRSSGYSGDEKCAIRFDDETGGEHITVESANTGEPIYWLIKQQNDH